MTKPAWHYWALAVLGLIWNGFGCANYLMQQSADNLAQMPENYQAFIAVRPAWATAAFALAVFGGALGSVLMLLRRKQASLLFALSLLGALGALVSVMGLGDMALYFGTGSSVLMAILLLVYTAKAHQNGLLR